MSIGKKSIARAANAAAKADTPEEVVVKAEEKVAEPVPAAEVNTEAKTEAAKAPVKAQTAKPKTRKSPKKNKVPEKFKKVQVGDDMPAFLL